MPGRLKLRLHGGWICLAVSTGLADHAQAQTAQQFQCPARVQAQAAEFESPGDLAGFAHRFPTHTAARLLRVSLQQRQGAQAADITPQVSRERRVWEIPSAAESTVTFWCHYEAGIALARPIRPGIRQCEAELSGPAGGLGNTSGRPSAELGRVVVACQ